MTCETGKKADLYWCFYKFTKFLLIRNGNPICLPNTSKHNPSCKANGEHIIIGVKGELKCVKTTDTPSNNCPMGQWDEAGKCTSHCDDYKVIRTTWDRATGNYYYWCDPSIKDKFVIGKNYGL